MLIQINLLMSLNLLSGAAPQFFKALSYLNYYLVNDLTNRVQEETKEHLNYSKSNADLNSDNSLISRKKRLLSIV
jgi:hypothetical protein